MIDDDPGPGDDHYPERLRAATNGVAPPARPAAPRTWPTAGDYLARMGPVGPRCSTGIASLDGLTGGGIPRRRCVMIIGTAGAGKTMLALQLAYRWEAAGAAVVYLAADQPGEDVSLRLGILAGFGRAALEADDDEARRAAARKLAGHIVILERATPIETALEALEEIAGDRQRVLFVDSIQTAECLAARGIEAPRAQITALIGVLRAAVGRGVIVVATSEANRAAGRPDGQVSALAAGAESRAIEHGADVQVVLTAVADAVGQVDIAVPKNRLGRTPDRDYRIRLRIDFDGASLSEIAVPDPEASEREIAAAKIAKARHRVRQALSAPGAAYRSAGVLARRAGGNRQETLDMIREMRASGEIVEVDGVLRLSSSAVPDEK